MIIYSPTFTGSVQITGSQTVTGDLTVQGNLTAQTFILSSSVSYFTESFASGSTRFGDSMDDTMVVTGSMRVTGSLAMTGSATVNGTASFQTVGNNGIVKIGGSAYYSQLETNSDLGGLKLKSIWGGANSGVIQLINGTNENVRMHITDGGNIGIGTTNPADKLTVFEPGGSTTSTIKLDSTGNTIKGHLGVFNNNFYIGSNWFYAGAQYSDSLSYGQSAIVLETNTTAGNILFQTSGTPSTSPTTKMFISASGLVGIGTTNPAYSLHIVSTSSWLKASYSSASDTRATEIFYAGIKTTAGTSQSNNMIITMEGGYTADGSGAMVFNTGSPTATERMRIKSNGYVNVGTSGTSDPVSDDLAYTQLGGSRSTFYAKGSAPLGIGRGTNTGNIIEFYYNGVNAVGNISTNGSTITFSGNAASDSRLKDNIQPITNALDVINTVEFVTFKFKENNRDSAGVTAQNLQTIEKLSPFVIEGVTEEDYKAVDYNAIIGYLGKAIQELKAEIDELKNK